MSAIDNGNLFVFCDFTSGTMGCVRGAGHSGSHAITLPPYPQQPVILLASPKASPLQAERLSKFLCHLEACESNPDPYPYAWREADAATCDCGLAAALGASRPSPAERQEKK